MYDSTGRKNNWALPIVNMKQAKERWNNKFKKKMVVSFLPFWLSEAFDKIKAWRTAIVHIRVNEQFVRDALDWRIDNLIVDKTTGGHALCLSYDKVKQDYYFTDNYLGVKQKNEYYISEDIIKAMIKKGLMFDSAYYAIKGKVLSPK
jgi:DNA phosphorothioation-dependent restriction protein DptG